MIGIKTVTVLYSSFCKVQKGGFLTGLDCIQGLKWGFPGVLVGKESACSAGDPDSIPGLGWSPGKGNGNPFQYSYLENPINREAWRGTVHGIAKSQTGLSDWHFYFQGLRWSSLPIWMRLPGPLILSQVVLLLFPPRVEHDLATKPPTFLWLATVLPFGTERRWRRLSLAYDKWWTKKPLCPGIPQGPAWHHYEYIVMHVCFWLLSHVRLCDLMDCSLGAPLSLGFSRQEYWSGLPFPSPGSLLNPGIESASPAWQLDSLPLSHQGSII